MIIRLGMKSLTGVVIIALLALSPCAVENATATPPEYQEIDGEPNTSPTVNGDREPAIANYGVLLDPTSDGDQSFNSDFISDEQNGWSDGAPERAAITKRHLATLARDGDIAARKLHRNTWWDHLAHRDEEGSAYSGGLKRTLASLARQGDAAARRLSQYKKRYQDDPDSDPEPSSDAYDDQGTTRAFEQVKRNLASMARLGDDAARRLNYQTRSWGDPQAGGDDPLGDWMENGGTGPEADSLLAKRNLASLARNGDAAARRLSSYKRRLWDREPESEEDSFEETDLQTDGAPDYDAAPRKMYPSSAGTVSHLLQQDAPVKRHVGALAREGALKNMWQFGKGIPKPWNYGGQDLWYKPPKRDDDDDTWDDSETVVENDEETPLALVKKHIAALARRGTLASLRWHRRPLPPSRYMYKNGDDYGTILSNGGYKRNIQSLARTAPPGSGFRSWPRGRFWSPSESAYQLNSRLRSASQDRARGVRSTHEGYRDALPRSPAALAYRSYDAFRAPMAFISRHMAKRASDAIYPRPEVVEHYAVILKELHPKDQFPQSVVELSKASSDHAESEAPKGGSNAPRFGSGQPKGQKAGLRQQAPASKEKQ